MSADTSFDAFEKEHNRLVDSFGQRLAELKQPGYAEAPLRDDFLNPFLRALGWNMENRAGLSRSQWQRVSLSLRQWDRTPLSAEDLKK